MSEFQVRKDAITETRIVSTNEPGSVDDGQVLLSVERFGFSANNITYAVVGHRIGYWKFFPPKGEDAGDWGLVPVWGFGVVEESKCEDIAVGERIFGYFPPAQSLLVSPTHVTGATFVDGSEHRASLPAGYNTYRRVNGEPNYNPQFDNERMLLWPLLITSFCLWDALQQKDWYGAKQLIIVSASSKTAIGLAYASHADSTSPTTVGLTSARNVEFVNELPPYERAFSYADIEQLDANIPSVVVDMAGNADVLGKLYQHLGSNMKHCLNVGLTHWNEEAQTTEDLRERSEFFFAPDHIAGRIKDWGMDGFSERTTAFIACRTLDCSAWLKINTLAGLPELSAIYDQVCDGVVPPSEGLVVALQGVD